MPEFLSGNLSIFLSGVLPGFLFVILSGVLSMVLSVLLQIPYDFLCMKSLYDSVQEHPGQRVWRFVFNDVRLAVNKDTRDYLRMNLFNTVRTATNNKAWAIIDLLTYERFI